MNWITLKDCHVNLDQLQYFSMLSKGRLTLKFAGQSPMLIDDPDRRWYTMLCNRVSLLPVKKEDGSDD